MTLSKLWDDMLSRIRPKKRNKFSVCILYTVCSLHFVSGMQFAVSILYWPDWYCCFCSSEPQVRTEILGLEKKILVGLSWPLWLMSGLYVKELPRKSTVIEQWLLYTNWRRTQMRGLPIWLPLIPFCVVTACVDKWCEPFGFSIQVAFLEVRKCDLRFFYQTIRTFYFFPREFLSFIEIDLDFY